MFITNKLRIDLGQFAYATDAYMIAHGIERTGNCAACGHEINLHVGVVSPAGEAMWVGSNCAATLTAGSSPACVHTERGIQEYITPSEIWVQALHVAAFSYNKIRNCYDEKNRFLADVFRYWQKGRKVSIKQYAAVNTTLAV